MEDTNKMQETTKKDEQTSTQKIGIYLWIWLLLFVLSFFSYMVDWYQFQGMLRWSLILFFMFLKAGLIMAFFMHLFWERYALVNVLLWPMTAIACFVVLMVAEGKYVFALPGSSGGVTDAWDGILKHQLDVNNKPCNFVELIPRLKEK